MKLATSVLLFAAGASAFAPQQQGAFRSSSSLFSTETAEETKVRCRI